MAQDALRVDFHHRALYSLFDQTMLTDSDVKACFLRGDYCHIRTGTLDQRLTKFAVIWDEKSSKNFLFRIVWHKSETIWRICEIMETCPGHTFSIVVVQARHISYARQLRESHLARTVKKYKIVAVICRQGELRAIESIKLGTVEQHKADNFSGSTKDFVFTFVPTEVLDKVQIPLGCTLAIQLRRNKSLEVIKTMTL